jgi:hypothetical protein
MEFHVDALKDRVSSEAGCRPSRIDLLARRVSDAVPGRQTEGQSFCESRPTKQRGAWAHGRDCVTSRFPPWLTRLS